MEGIAVEAEAIERLGIETARPSKPGRGRPDDGARALPSTAAEGETLTYTEPDDLTVPSGPDQRERHRR